MPTTDKIQISAKDIGAMALEGFCPRCFWIKRKAKKLPWQIFPGIFSSIDAYVKRVVHKHIDLFGVSPEWLTAGPGREIIGYLPATHWSKFKMVDPGTGIIVSGATDDILVCDDDLGDIIVDYKTAKHTENADKLLPMYIAQLNGYADIYESMGGKVSALQIIYCEPMTDIAEYNPPMGPLGYALEFQAKTLPVFRDGTLVPALLRLASPILAGAIPAAGIGCKDCEALDSIIKTAIIENIAIVPS